MNLRNKSGITLIALIVTIIVLMIIAGISIGTLTSDNGVIRQTNSAKVLQIEGTVREQVQLACAALRIVIAEAGAQDNSYSAKANSNLIQRQLVKLLNDDISNLNGEFKPEGTEVGKNQASFNIIYEGQDYKNACNTSKAKITYTIGLTQKTLQLTGEVGTRIREPNSIEEGTYVYYNVPYTDMYSSNPFSETTGWRYMGKDAAGNKLIISTGIPVNLYYYYSATSTIGRDANGWWGTDQDVTELYGEKYAASGYIGYKDRYAAAGLIRHFESIAYEQTTSPSKTNIMTGLIAGNGTEGVFGPTIGTAFRATDINEKNQIIDVHALTLEELNRALERPESSTAPISDDTTGLFYLMALSDEYGYSTSNSPTYYLASPYMDAGRYLRRIDANGTASDKSSRSNWGLRVVITLDSSVDLKDTDGDGIVEIH